VFGEKYFLVQRKLKIGLEKIYFEPKENWFGKNILNQKKIGLEKIFWTKENWFGKYFGPKKIKNWFGKYFEPKEN
jgi:hypothetical protein